MGKFKGWLCYLNGNEYFDGVAVLFESLQQVKTKYPFYCMVVNVSDETKAKLDKMGIVIIEKRPYPFPSHFYKNENDKLKYWVGALDKLQIFSLYNEFEKFVYLDCDMMVYKNIDHLFEKQDMTASEDAYYVTGNEGHKNFNAGLMVVEPCEVKWNKLESFFLNQFAPTKLKKAFPDGGCVHDQLILNLFFSNWKEVPTAHLLCTYNIFALFADKYKMSLSYEDIFVVHYTTKNKPFMKQVYDCYPKQRRFARSLTDRLFIEYIKLLRKTKKKYNV